MEPTKEQIKWLWEQCEWHKEKHPKGNWYMWYAPDGRFVDNHLPPIDLNNLFKYAVPKLKEVGFNVEICTTTSPTQFRTAIKDRGFSLVGRLVWDDDPAIALFWAIYKCLGGKK